MERGGKGEDLTLTIHLLQHALHSPGAAAASHLDVEFVVVFCFRHWGCGVDLERKRSCGRWVCTK